jgi:hypothetical protein
MKGTLKHISFIIWCNAKLQNIIILKIEHKWQKKINY